MAFAVIEDAEDKDRRLFLHAKNNLAAPPQGLAFRLQQTTVGELGIVASRVVLEPSPVSITANEALAAEAGPGTEKGAPRGEAKDFLRQMLAEGPVDVDTVNTQAKALGITERTLKRARHDLGVKATKGDFEGGWQPRGQPNPLFDTCGPLGMSEAERQKHRRKRERTGLNVWPLELH